MKNFAIFLINKSIGLYINLYSYVNPTKATKIAYTLFSHPLNGKYTKNNLPKALEEPEAESLEYDGHSLQTYTWKGNDTVVLLAHGWESNASRWAKLLPYLKKSGSTIIAIDAPAHGMSGGKEFTVIKYAAFIDVVVAKFKPQFLIGHSIGGQACLYYQSVYQNVDLQKIVVLGTPSDLQIIFNNYRNTFSFNSKIVKGFQDYCLKNFNFDMSKFSSNLFVSNIKTKGMIAHDINDEIVLFEEGKKISNAWDDSIFIKTKGLGHSMHDDALYQKVFNFLFEPK